MLNYLTIVDKSYLNKSLDELKSKLSISSDLVIWFIA